MFLNREDAGNKLGKALEKYQSEHLLVLGIPRGGVEVGYYAALYLDCDFDVIVVRKLGHPRQPEAAFGALAEDGSLYLDPQSGKYLSKEIIEKVVENEKNEIKRRIKIYRQGKDLTNLTDRVVILIDDGIATGATVFAALAMCRKKHPQKLVVAAPISGLTKLRKLEVEADEVIIQEKKERFYAVSQGYLEFGNLSDEEVIHFLNLWQKRAGQRMRSNQ